MIVISALAGRSRAPTTWNTNTASASVPVLRIKSPETVRAAAAEYTPGVSVVAPTVVESSVVVRNLLVARYSDSKSALMDARSAVLMLPVCVIVAPERAPTDPTSPVTVVVPALLKAAPEKAAYVLAWPKVNAESCSALI